MESSRDYVSLERLETIGDSFLKFCVSRHLYAYFPELDEGKMTQWRSQLVSNAHLYQIGKKFKLGEFLASGFFIPESCWLPPGFKCSDVLAKTAAKFDINDDVFADKNLLELEVCK